MMAWPPAASMLARADSLKAAAAVCPRLRQFHFRGSGCSENGRGQAPEWYHFSGQRGLTRPVKSTLPIQGGSSGIYLCAPQHTLRGSRASPGLRVDDAGAAEVLQADLHVRGQGDGPHVEDDIVGAAPRPCLGATGSMVHVWASHLLGARAVSRHDFLTTGCSQPQHTRRPSPPLMPFSFGSLRYRGVCPPSKPGLIPLQTWTSGHTMPSQPASYYV